MINNTTTTPEPDGIPRELIKFHLDTFMWDVYYANDRIDQKDYSRITATKVLAKSAADISHLINLVAGVKSCWLNSSPTYGGWMSCSWEVELNNGEVMRASTVPRRM
jgi:hypothetical protein